MRIRNESDGKLPTWRKGRLFAWSWLRIEWAAFCRHSLNAAISAGATGFHAAAPWFYLFVNWRDDEDRDRGCFEVRWADGTLRFEHPWVRDDWRSDDPWWRKAIRIPIADWLLGRVRYESTEGEPCEVFVPMAEGCYLATAKSVVHTHRRRWYWPAGRFETWKIDIPGGIPFSGKGENSWDCGDDGLFGISCPATTVEEAIGHTVASVLRSRARHGHDCKNTGREPVRICNEEASR